MEKPVMFYRCSTWTIALVAVSCLTPASAWAFDETKYPDWKGQWSRLPVAGINGNLTFDPNKPEGLAQQAPLTPEYQAILEASLADQAAGGAGRDRTYVCFSPGMPHMMSVPSWMEIIVMPDTTHILIGFVHDIRRIYTDGRDWPDDLDLSTTGYSIGKWVNGDRDGHYTVLEVETRGFKGVRTFETSGLPLHDDNQSVIKERIYSDKTDRNILHDEITVIDHALTRPWTVTKSYRRAPQARPLWRESPCVEENQHIRIGKNSYMLSADGLLMPVEKNQPPPDLRYFNQSPK